MSLTTFRMPRESSLPPKIPEGNEFDNDNDNDDNDDDDDVMSSTRGGSSDRPIGEDGNTKTGGKNIADKESKRVFVSRAVMGTCLTLAATIFVLCAYLLTAREERRQFEEAFESLSEELIQVSQVNANNKFQALRTLGLSMTSMAQYANRTWPFVTHPNFEAEAGQIRKLLGALWVALVPVVRQEDRAQWETYSVANQGWAYDSFVFRGMPETQVSNITEFIFRRHFNNGSEYYDNLPLDPELPYYTPAWQTSEALPDLPNINLNVLSDPFFKKVFLAVTRTNQAVLSEAFSYSLYLEAGHLPESYLLQPVYSDFATEDQSTFVGVVGAFVPWNYFDNILSSDIADGVYIVLKNPCGSAFSFIVHGPNATFLGGGDLHDRDYNDMEIVANASEIKTPEDCRYTMHLYPSKQMEDSFLTNMPWILSLAGIAIFAITGIVFVVYNRLVEQRQDLVLETAHRSGAIVDSFYPAAVRDRLLNDEAMQETFGSANHPSSKNGDGGGRMFGLPLLGYSKTSVQHANSVNNIHPSTIDDHSSHAGALLGGSAKGGSKSGDDNAISVFPTKPIADYYPEGTIMVADLVGFAAWSSVREPAQVFTLLETLYNSFDKIGKKRRVFKVETLGDCYVAAGGIPDPMKDHAVVMAAFARDCKRKMKEVVEQLEIWLGPDTADLSIRLALHSGPATAGVLRGEKSRFQLFGETIDNAFILESTGSRNKIHVSHATATLLRAAGKNHWLVPRTNKVVMKGKVEAHTYWLDIRSKPKPRTASTKTDNTDAMSTASSRHHREPLADTQLGMKTNEDNETSNMSDRQERLVGWSTDILIRLLKMVVAVRDTQHSPTDLQDAPFTSSTNPLDEVQEIIKLRSDTTSYRCDPAKVELSASVQEQLRDFVSIIANLYRDNRFHCFEHACHVTQAVTKLLSRVVTPDEIDTSTMSYKQKAQADELHKYTYGITSDPLIQFSCALSALIHDVDHPGVPNAQLVKEKTRTASVYNNKSVAEQNSVDLAWNVLMEPSFEDLRRCIYTNGDELNRFRQLVVNSVMATDIVDKELGALRKERWLRAFSNDPSTLGTGVLESEEDKVNRKATIVIEHVVQAADVSHMMQHWHIYLKWNERFFQECYRAYLDGRADKNPCDGWYKGEIGFFDFYIIPLAKKLKDCGVFGVSSDEFLNYAIENRNGWEAKGEEIVAVYKKNFEKKYEMSSRTPGASSKGSDSSWKSTTIQDIKPQML